MISYTILFCLSHAVSNIIIWSGMVSFYSLNRLTCEDFIIWLHFMLQWVGAVTFVNFVKLHRQKSPLTIVSSVSTAHRSHFQAAFCVKSSQVHWPTWSHSDIFDHTRNSWSCGTIYESCWFKSHI